MSFKISTLAALAALALSIPGWSQVKKSSLAGITEYEYPNGLRVLLIPDSSSPRITVNVVYLVGSRHEGYGESGMAHLLEHMNFIQTTTGRNIKKEIQDHGAQWNGTTSYDRTNYYETFPASDDNLKWALSLEADRMVKVKMDKALLDTEMTVVRNEFERGENSPQRILQERVLSTAYLWHNYGKSVIGSRIDIEHVPIDRLAAFYQRFYQPDNAVVVIAGQIDPAKTLQYVGQSLGALPRPTRKLEEPYTKEPTQDGERYVELRRVGVGKSVMIAWHAPAMAHPDSAAMEVLTDILNGANGTGRLPKALVDNGKALRADIGFDEMHDAGYVMASATLNDTQSLDDAKQALLETIAGIVKEPPTKEEVERVKNRTLQRMEQSLGNSQQMAMTMTSMIADGDWRLYFLNYDQIKAVNPDDVVRVAKLYFKDSNRTVGVFIPTPNPDRTVVPDAADPASLFKDYKSTLTVSEAAAFDPTPSNIEKNIVRSRLQNDARVALLSKASRQNIVRADIELRFGDEKSLVEKDAIASLTGSLLMRGTKNKTKQQLQEEMDALKTRIRVNGGLSGATASLETTKENLIPAIKLAMEILREPGFPESEFEQAKRQQLGAIERGKTEPASLAGEVLQRNLFPFPKENVRYVRTIEERIADLGKVKLDDVKKFHAQFYGASDALVAIVGPFDVPQVQKALADSVGAWKSPGRWVRVNTPYIKTENLDRRIVTPDKENAVFQAGMRMKITDTDPEFPALVIANYMFGGSITSRLGDRIRNREGLSYSVGSQVMVPADGDGGTFMVSAISNPLKAPQVETSFRDELVKTLADGFTAEELAVAKKAYLDQRRVGRSQDAALLGLILQRENFDRTLDWDTRMDAKLEAVTLDQANAAFRKYITPAAVSAVKAGDFK